MRSSKITLLAAAMLALLASAAAAQTPEQARARAVPPITDGDDGSYRLSPGDLIEIKFMLNPELNETVRIRPDGRISMPLVGEMLVARTSERQGRMIDHDASASMEKKKQEGYF